MVKAKLWAAPCVSIRRTFFSEEVRMATVKRVGPGSAFKVGLITYAILGLVLGVFMAIVSTLVGGLGTTASNVPGAKLFGFGMGIGSIIVFPICYGLIGGIFAAIGAFIYNLAAGWVGGLEVDIS
jgi:Transmembrane domain of unknown function (DUF3566)